VLLISVYLHRFPGNYTFYWRPTLTVAPFTYRTQAHRRSPDHLNTHKLPGRIVWCGCVEPNTNWINWFFWTNWINRMAIHCNKTLQHNIATLQYNFIDGVETCVEAVHRDKLTSLSRDKPRPNARETSHNTNEWVTTRAGKIPACNRWAKVGA